MSVGNVLDKSTEAVHRGYMWCNLAPYRTLAWATSLGVTSQLWNRLPRGDGSLMDVGNHIGNVSPSMLVGGLGAVAAAKVAEAIPRPTRERVLVAAIAGAAVVGAAINLAAETRTGQSLTGLFVGSYPQWQDALYGEVAALASAAIVSPHLAQENTPQLPSAPHQRPQ